MIGPAPLSNGRSLIPMFMDKFENFKTNNITSYLVVKLHDDAKKPTCSPTMILDLHF